MIDALKEIIAQHGNLPVKVGTDEIHSVKYNAEEQNKIHIAIGGEFSV